MKQDFSFKITAVVFAKDKSPLSKYCLCYVCKTFTRAYIHHLFRAQELLAYRLASYHNMFFINNFGGKIWGDEKRVAGLVFPRGELYKFFIKSEKGSVKFFAEP